MSFEPAGTTERAPSINQAVTRCRFLIYQVAGTWRSYSYILNRMQSDEILVTHGTDMAGMVYEILDAAKLDELIPENALIALKPNLVVAKEASSGAVTHPEIVGAVVEWLRDRGFRRFSIMEGSWVGDKTSRAFKTAGYSELSKRLEVPLVDLQKDSWTMYEAGGGAHIAVCDAVMAADILINMPVLKGHCQTNITCALKNLKGCIPDHEKSRFHQRGLHEPIARLNKILKPGFILVDAICGDPDFEEGGNPLQMDRIIAARDPVLTDALACRLLGRRIEAVPYIGLAESLGVGSADLSGARIRLLGDTPAPAVQSSGSGRVEALSARVDQRSACSSCYSSLIRGLAFIDDQGELSRLDTALADTETGRIAIGLGFRDTDIAGWGWGNCCTGADRFVPGCPPDGEGTTEVEKLLSRVR